MAQYTLPWEGGLRGREVNSHGHEGYLQPSTQDIKYSKKPL